MRLFLIAPLLSAVVAAGAAEPAPKPVRAPAAPSEWTCNLNAFIGGKILDHDAWDPVDGQGAFGVEVDLQHHSWPVALAVSVIGSGGTHKDDVTNTTNSGSTAELQLGARKIWTTPGMMRFAIAGGLDVVGASTKVETPSTTTKEHGSGAGYWVSGGFYWTFARHFNVGPQVGFSSAEVQLANQTVQAGGIFIGLVAGGTF